MDEKKVREEFEEWADSQMLSLVFRGEAWRAYFEATRRAEERLGKRIEELEEAVNKAMMALVMRKAERDTRQKRIEELEGAIRKHRDVFIYMENGRPRYDRNEVLYAILKE